MNDVDLEARIVERDARIVELESRIKERDARIADLEARIKERDARIVEREARIIEFKKYILERDARIVVFQARLSEHEAKSERKTKYDYAWAKAAYASNLKLGNGLCLLRHVDQYVLTYGNQPLVCYSPKQIILYADECGTTSVRRWLNKYTPDKVKVVQRDFAFFVLLDGVEQPFDTTFTLEMS